MRKRGQAVCAGMPHRVFSFSPDRAGLSTRCERLGSFPRPAQTARGGLPRSPWLCSACPGVFFPVSLWRIRLMGRGDWHSLQKQWVPLFCHQHSSWNQHAAEEGCVHARRHTHALNDGVYLWVETLQRTFKLILLERRPGLHSYELVPTLANPKPSVRSHPFL